MLRVEERAPDGFDDLEKLLPLKEREEIDARYKQAAGFDMQTLNSKPSLSAVRYAG